MLTDERKHIRELACRRILAARRKNLSRKTIREFRVPKLNFSAENYIDLVDWSSVEKYDPPLMKNTKSTDEELEAYVSNPETTKYVDLPKFPCHTQATERCIRLVTEASAAV